MTKIIQISILYIILVPLLKLFNLTQISWILFFSPFILVLATFLMYLTIMLTTSFTLSYIQEKKEKKHLKETEISFHCEKCAKPLKEPIRHYKNETIICKSCNSKI